VASNRAAIFITANRMNSGGIHRTTKTLDIPKFKFVDKDTD